MFIFVSSGTVNYNKDAKNSNFEYNLENFVPVDTEKIYLKIYSLEQDIKRNENDIYLRLKEFMFDTNRAINTKFVEITKFSEEVADQLYKNKRLSKKWLKLPESEFLDLVQDLCFEILYPKLVKLDENKNLYFQEKMFVLQNIITPQMLSIKDEHFAYNVYQLSFNEMKKINAVKSPRNKCNVIFQSINCLSSKFKNMRIFQF